MQIGAKEEKIVLRKLPFVNYLGDQLTCQRRLRPLNEKSQHHLHWDFEYVCKAQVDEI
jgi:hypothetical protein